MQMFIEETMSAHPLSHPVTYIYVYLRELSDSWEVNWTSQQECHGFFLCKLFNSVPPSDLFFWLCCCNLYNVWAFAIWIYSVDKCVNCQVFCVFLTNTTISLYNCTIKRIYIYTNRKSKLLSEQLSSVAIILHNCSIDKIRKSNSLSERKTPKNT